MKCFRLICPTCLLCAALVVGIASWNLTIAQESTQAPTSAPSKAAFHRIHRPNAVDVEKEYDLSNLSIPRDEIHELLPRDAIPALTDPKLESVADADWLKPTDRVVAIAIENDAVAVPLHILDWHEIANLTVGGQAVAATYCPLCDSATVISRTVTYKDDAGEEQTETLEFGVSGALYNSNVLMYDRKYKALWSQLAQQAVSGPLAGTPLKHLPVRLTTFAKFAEKHSKGKVVSRDTGHQRGYGSFPYRGFGDTDRLLVPVKRMGDALPRKTLGVGVQAASKSWFIPVDVIGARYELKTPAGPVVITSSEAGIAIESQPSGVRTAQTYFYSWSAFHPKTQVERE